MTQEKIVSKPAQGVGATKEKIYESELTNLGSLRKFATDNDLVVNLTVVESKASGLPTLWMKDANDNVIGVIMSQNAGTKFPVGSRIDADNVYVQERVINGEKGYIITTGGSITWERL